jgi:NAD(P)-dependent dehydrogenase (short-subunit alcohol dehydrogenase family)
MPSAARWHGYADPTAYAAAKWGVIEFTRSLAKELEPANIRVNAILPGIVEGKTHRERDRRACEAARHPLCRDGDEVSRARIVAPRDVAAMVAFLLSPIGENLSGQSLGRDGNVETL